MRPRPARAAKWHYQEQGRGGAAAEMKLADELDKMERAKGTRGNLAGKSSGTGKGQGKAKRKVTGGAALEPPVTPTLKEMGVDKKRAARARRPCRGS
jgi:hypothetical protein